MWIYLHPDYGTRSQSTEKLATRSTCMDDGCISNKLVTPKSICLPTFCSYRESTSQNNEGQVHVDHNNTSVAFPTMVHPVIENVYIRSNFHPPISKSFDRSKPNPTPIVTESNVSLSGMEGLRAHCIITKRGGKSGVAGAFQEKLIPLLQV